jgi:SAM-dependent methyltransferase
MDPAGDPAPPRLDRERDIGRREETMALTPIPIDIEQLRAQIQEKYREVATKPELGFHFHTGRRLAAMLAYPPDEIDALPDEVVESFAGVNNPFTMGAFRPGETVVDIGSGAGLDALLAARMVGPAGRVIGVDMTPAMREKATANARRCGLANAEFMAGFAEALPLADASADVVISNGVINLCPDKLAVYREIFRVLKPGGRVQIADVVVQKPVPQEAKEDIDLWTG